MNQLPPDDAKPRQLYVEPSGNNKLTSDQVLPWLVPDRRRLAAWSMQALTEKRFCFSSPVESRTASANSCGQEGKTGIGDLKASKNRVHGLIGQAINQYGWNALLIDSTGEVLWTSVKGLKWIGFSTDSTRRKRWRRTVDRWWQNVLDRPANQNEHVGCIWGRKRLWLTQWSASQPDCLLIAMLRPSQLRGLMHHRWLEVLANAAS